MSSRVQSVALANIDVDVDVDTETGKERRVVYATAAPNGIHNQSLARQLNDRLISAEQK